ncbi:hypothetical protein BD289DRAFT_235431 [Coniella lustricola]|uniref:Secreted protein n=1 Tax=Coniella lustricola TaxID=2025994 RepID=A0A2T3A9Y9_9PEZI|nr:hypothetical protein BD289DRAFT_235431 [Coniella lustricola]
MMVVAGVFGLLRNVFQALWCREDQRKEHNETCAVVSNGAVGQKGAHPTVLAEPCDRCAVVVKIDAYAEIVRSRLPMTAVENLCRPVERERSRGRRGVWLRKKMCEEVKTMIKRNQQRKAK